MGFVFTVSALPALARPPGQTRIPKRAPTRTRITKGQAKRRAASIRRFANRWIGTGYQWGGNTSRGIDCSGYSRQMYRDVFKIELPRTTRTQIKLGRDVPINTRRLGDGFEPGDMFFYVDPTGIPNHVVVYMGDGRFTHSASGRGVVVEGFRAVQGRRIVGRRVLIPARGGGAGQWAPIPAAPPIAPVAVPCPGGIRVAGEELRRFRSKALILADIKSLPEREICEWRALASTLRRRGGKHGVSGAKVIDEYVAWLQTIDSFKDEEF